MFYREMDLRQEPLIGEVASDWEVIRLEDALLLLRNGLTTTQNKEGNGYPVTRIETISEEKVDPSRVGYIHDLSEREISEYRLLYGDVLFSHINSLEHIGKTALYEGEPKSLIHGMNLLLLRSDKNRSYPRFLLYQLRLYRMKNIFRAMAKKAVNQASINQTELGRVKILLPSLDEQRGIVEVLSVVDLAIAKAGEVIAKTERLKKGLMQELLTKGIGHKEYKYSKELGCEIPEKWEVVKVKEITVDHKQGFYTDQPYIETGIRLVRVTDLLNPKLSYETMPCLSLNEKTVEQFKVSIGDFLIARSGAIGRYGIVAENIPCVFGSYIIRFRFDTSRVDNHFFGYLFESNHILGQLLRFKHGATNINVNAENIKTMTIPLPPLPEQRKIAEMMFAFDKKLELESNEKSKLERIKRGLMDLLLTGKIRVKVD